MSEQTPEPTELIYVPGDSWAPVLIAAGLALDDASRVFGALVVGRRSAP